MQVLQLLGSEQMEIVEAAEPEPAGELVVVRVMASTICGSEAPAYHAEGALSARRRNGGHEAAGVVVRTAEGSRLQEGDRVTLYAMNKQECGVCRHCLEGDWILCERPTRAHDGFSGTHAQFVVRREKMCFALPDAIGFDVGAVLLDCVGTPYRAIRRLGVSGADTVLITGQGPVGQSAAMICKFLGARVVTAELNDARRAHGLGFGVDVALNPAEDDVLRRVSELTGGRGVDVAIDCTGLAEPQVLCLDAVATKGRVALVGVKATVETPLRVQDHLLMKELTLIGSWYASASDYLGLLELVERGLPVEQLITHRFPLAEAAEAFRMSFGGGGSKVIIDPWG